jgi:acyl-CoA thioesterase
VRAEVGRNILRMPLDGRHLNPNGVALGAALFAMADIGMGLACESTCGPGQSAASTDVSMRFLEAARAGDVLLCETGILRKGRRVAFLESELRTETGRVVAKASGTFVFTDRA